MAAPFRSRWLAPYGSSRLAEGYIIASAGDMTRYLLATMHGGTYGGVSVLPAERVAEMLAPAAPMGTGPGAGAYGMGWTIARRAGEVVYEHGGSTQTFSAAMAILPGRSRGLIILANATPDATGGVTRLEDALIALLAEQPAVLAPAVVPQSVFPLLIGLPALLLWQLWDVVRLFAWRRRLRAQGLRPGDRAAAACSLVVALGCLAGVPLAYAATPRLMWAVDPIDTVLILGAGGLALGALCCRSAVLLRTWSGGQAHYWSSGRGKVRPSRGRGGGA